MFHPKKMLATFAVGLSLQCAMTGTAAADKANDTLTAAFQFQLPTFDRYYAGGREGYLLGLLVYDALVYRDPETLEFKPLLAKGWRQIDHLTLEFDLQQGVKFHNGDDFTAADVVYTINFVMNPDNKIFSPETAVWIDKVEAVGDHTVHIRAKKPTPLALNYIMQLAILPAQYHQKAGKDAFGRAPVGTGPYKVARGSGNSVIFTRNEEYFDGGGKNKPHIGKLVYKTVPDVTAQVAELMTGAVDWAYYIPTDLTERMRNNPRIKITNADTFRVGFLTMNIANNAPENSPLRDIRVRQALNYAIDRKAVATSLIGPAAQLINSACSPLQFACRQDLPAYEYNPEKARALLAEAGYPNGFDIDVYGYRSRPVAEAILGYLRAVNVRGDLKWMQYPAVVKARRDGQATIVIDDFGSSGVADAGYILSFFFNETSDDLSRDPEVSALVTRGNELLGPAERKASYGAALERISGKAYWVPLFTMPINYVFSSSVDIPVPRDENVEFWRARWK
ncbi:ABC transporter substrate-binding protein [Microvirga zambiensis]|uniref:ABC transporter substrate-binding protein n=1 Tax=Microvirga zambiensis TaxID=1402137 RepID=UPI00191D6501|nr:ABC transporter substrate-binding protein [Microvirga zambiensis]